MAAASGIFALLLGSVVGCSADGPPPRLTLSVFAAASLTDAFRDLARSFEAGHPEVDVRLNFAGSQVLRLQLEHGAAADIFASANAQHVAALVDGGLIADSQTFAHNELVVIVPTDNPAAIGSWAELPRAASLVVGADNVPVGVYTRQVFERARAALGDDFVSRVRARVVSEENNVRLIRAKVELGEADAAIVYRSDVATSERVRSVDIPAELNVRVSYPIAPVLASKHPGLARQFVNHVLSRGARRILRRHGFAMGAQ